MTALQFVRAAAVAIAALFLISVPAFAGVTARAVVELKASPTVTGATITLGDVFENAGDASGTKVIAAPRPGQHISIDARSLASLALEHGLDWLNAAGLRSVDVTRASRPITAQAISELIGKALSTQAGGRNLDVRLLQGDVTLAAAADDLADPKVQIVSFEQQTGRFQASVDIPGAERVTISGIADEVMSVPVLARPFQRGEVIADADIAWTRLRIDTLGRQIVTDASDLVGLAARRPLRSGHPLMTGDIERPSAVIKGALVTMTYKVSGMLLTDTGRALQSGAIGDTVNVLNERSHRTIQARVVGANAVELAASAPLVPGPQASLEH